MSHRAVRILTVGVVAAVLAGGAWMVWRRITAPTPPSLTLASGPPSHAPIPARPVPATRPAPVAATGECGTAMARVRSLMRAYPSGSMLDESADQSLTTGLGRLDQACTTALDQAFRDRELTPWLTYIPPGSA